MKSNSTEYRLGQVLFYGTEKVLLLDIKPLLFYAKIRYIDSNKEASVNLKALSKQRKSQRTLSLGIFRGGIR
ncbi:MAG: hypothetical protein JJT76_09640 [Clostridiaceae bacterium]|nr:hypothetical protein [Clostridiaceae bacterium]